MMQSCASAARLLGGRPILILGFEAMIRLIRFGIRAFKVKLRQASKHLEELRGPEGEPLLQCFGSPRSQPRIARINNPASSRSVFARRCSRDTGMLVGWIT